MTNWIMEKQRNSPTQLTLFDALRLAEPQRAKCIKEFFISNKPYTDKRFLFIIELRHSSAQNPKEML